MEERKKKMELFQYFQSIIDQDSCPIVICNLEHTILYMNPTAITRYAKRGGEKLVGKNLLDCHKKQSKEQIQKVLLWFQESKEHNRIYTFYNKKENKNVYIIALRDKTGTLIGYYEKHEYRTKETKEYYHY